MSVKRPVVAILLSCLLACAHVHAGLLQTLPSAYVPWGVEGNYVVGGSNTIGGFIYNDVTHLYTTVPNSGAARGISGNIIVGAWGIYGFEYNRSTGEYTTLNDPLGVKTTPNGIDGDNVVGSYVDAAGKQHGFLYDIGDQTWTTLDYPGARDTILGDISEDYIVGYYYRSLSGPAHALIYDRTTLTWSTFGSSAMMAFGIDGDKVVGGVDGGGAGGWLYNISTGAIINPLSGVLFPPGQLVTSYQVHGISHKTIVGTYHYFNGSFFADSGFVYIGIPEMGTFALFGFSAASVAILLAGRGFGRNSLKSRRA